MSDKRGSWHLLTGGIIGILLGLLISMILSPVKYTNTEPSSLRSGDREVYRALIARAYLIEADTPRALSRLALLQDAAPADALVEQAQTLLATGNNEAEARALALLAAAVSQPSILITPLPITPLPSSTSAVSNTEQITITPTIVMATRTPAATTTSRPTFTPQPTQGAPFGLVEQSEICDPELPQNLIQVYILDSAGNPVPGVKIEISQPNGGVEYFYTGLYPEISAGYADYTMLQGMTYNLRVGEAGQLVLNLTIPVCENAGGDTYPGSIRLDYKQPE